MQSWGISRPSDYSDRETRTIRLHEYSYARQCTGCKQYLVYAFRIILLTGDGLVSVPGDGLITRRV